MAEEHRQISFREIVFSLHHLPPIPFLLLIILYIFVLMFVGVSECLFSRECFTYLLSFVFSFRKSVIQTVLRDVVISFYDFPRVVFLFFNFNLFLVNSFDSFSTSRDRCLSAWMIAYYNVNVSRFTYFLPFAFVGRMFITQKKCLIQGILWDIFI